MLAVETFQRWAQCIGLNPTGHWQLGSANEWILPAALLVVLAAVAARRILRVLLTFRALALAPVISRPLSKLVKSLDYSDDEFLRADGAGEHWVELRRLAIERLTAHF